MANSHDAPWLTNTKPKCFRFLLETCRVQCLVIGAVASCSTHVGLCGTETSATETDCLRVRCLVWCSGNGVGHINDVKLHRAW